MTRNIQIEQAILRMEPELFARMACAVLERDGYPRFNINTVSGKVRSRKNTPDAHCLWPDGTMTFLQGTAKVKKGLLNKLTNDLADCINKRPKSVPRKMIREVVLCSTERIHLEWRAALERQAKTLKVRLNLYDLDRILEVLLNKGEDIVHDHLGISLGTGQIHTRASFVERAARSPHATNYKTTFCFREEIVVEALVQLTASKVVLLAGHGGVGKTRLAMEVVDRLIQAEPGLHTWYIRSTGQPLAAELQERCAAPGHYVLLVDDAHKLDDFQRVLELLENTRPDRTFRMVCTVRRVLLSTVLEATHGYYTGAPIELKPWSDDEIRTFLYQEYQIGHKPFVDRILVMAQGNPRIAAMVASVIHKAEGYDGFQNVAQAFQLYYGEDKATAAKWQNDPEMLRVLWAFSFFLHIEGSPYQPRILPELLPLLEMDSSAFWNKARALDQIELVDLLGTEGPGLLADDTFGTYVVHKVLFQEKTVALDALLIACFPQHRERIVLAINGVLAVFNSDNETQYLGQAVTIAIEHFTAVNNAVVLGELHEAFWELDATRSLVFAQKLIEATPAEPPTDVYDFGDNKHSTSILDTPLRVLRWFGDSPDAGLRATAAELMLSYMRRCPSKAAMVAQALAAAFNMHENAAAQDYLPQRQLVQMLIEHSKVRDAAATGLFFVIAKNYLSVESWLIKPARKRNAYTKQLHKPDMNGPAKALRNMVWGHVFDQWQDPAQRERVLQVLHDHMNNWYTPANKALLIFDVGHIAPFCIDHLDRSDLDHCALVHELLHFWEHRGVYPEQLLGDHFMNDTLRLKAILGYDRHMADIDSDVEKGYESWKRRLQALGEGTSPVALRRMLTAVRALVAKDKGSTGYIGTSTAMEHVLLGATQEDPQTLLQELRLAFRLGNPLKLGPGYLLPHLLDGVEVHAIDELLSSNTFEQQELWWRAFYTELGNRELLLPNADIFEQRVMQMLDVGYFVPLQLVGKFQMQCPGLIITLMRATVEKMEAGKDWSHGLADIFSKERIELDKLISEFTNDKQLLQRAFYFSTRSGMIDKAAPRIFRALLDADASFTERWVKWRYHTDYTQPEPEEFQLHFIWERSDAIEQMDAIYAVAYKKLKVFCGNDDYLTSFFLPHAKEELTHDVTTAQDAWLRKHLEQDHEQLKPIQVLMGIVHALPQERRLSHLEHFMDQKPDDHIFSETVLDMRLDRVTLKVIGAGHGKLEYLELLLTRCDSLSRLPYRKLIEVAIKNVKREIREEEVDHMIEERW